MSKNTQLGNLVNGIFVDSTGKVGVGNVSPTVALDVTGAGKFSDTITAATGISVGLTGTNYINWSTQGGIKLGRANIGPEDSLTSRWTGTLAYIDIAYSAQWNGGVTILANGGGNVGIGTNTPSANANQTSLTINGTNNSRLDMQVSGTRKAGFVVASDAAYLETTAAIPLVFYTNSAERMRITSGGNILMGTTTDNGNRLNVSGNISSSGTVSGSTGSFSVMSASSFRSFKGVTSIAAGATATIYTMDTMGLYTVQASFVGSSIIFCAAAIFYAQIYSANYVKCIDLLDGANITLFNSGSAIQVRNDGFATYSFDWTILFQPAF
jgi:hypothetical protein